MKYSKKFYHRESRAYDSGKIILKYILDKISINSVIDFGCGVGPWLKAAKDLGGNSDV